MDFRKESYVVMLILLGFLLLCKAQAAVYHYDFVLREKNFTKLCRTKSILTVNGSFPGPTISAHKGDTIYVTVHNNGTYGVTIHWHGVRQPNDPWSDGPENITQCPIAAGAKFTQRVNLASEEGTLWWHAHSDWTRATVHGAIIIKPPPGSSYPFPQPYAQETLIIGEWYKGDVMTLIKDALATGGEPNTSDAYTINGQPGDLYDCSNGTTHRFSVVPGKTYLLRIINAAMNEDHFFGITNHTLTLVGTDAAYVKPFTTPYLFITPGQTMDVLLTANRKPGLYYMVASPYHDGASPYDATKATAILQYHVSHLNTSYLHPPTVFPDFPLHNDSSAAFNFSKRLRGLGSKDHPIHVPKKVTKRIYMTVAVNSLACNASTCSSTTKLAASLNNVSFQVPSIDILNAYYWKKEGVFTKDFPKEPPHYVNFTDPNNNAFTTTGTRVIMLNYNDSVEIVWQGTNNTMNTAENHPMHLHGFSYYVVGQGWGVFNNKTDPKSYNLVDPPEVNTIGLPINGWLAMRFVANNPGVWFMHCHFERHSSWGMDTVLIVKDGKTKGSKMLPHPNDMPPREEKNFTKLCSTKSILTVNGSFPGPTIRVQKGDTAFVTLHNKGSYGVTIHWHGVREPRDPWSDGPENITQCPIPPGTSFTQKLAFTSEEGTLWWHAHSSWTRATVHGAIIIFPANNTSYPFPQPHAQETIIIGEWYKGDVQQIINSALLSGGEPNKSDAYTINGEPGDFYNCSRETTYRSLVDYGKTYLFRIINSAMNEEHFFGIAHHNLTVVGMDASYTKPLKSNFIMIAPGQTMDVLVTADQNPDQNYYIAASPFYDGNAFFDNSTATAILQYTNNNSSSSSRAIALPVLPALNDSGTVFNFSKRLRSLASKDHAVNVPKNVNRRIYMTASVNVLPCPNSNCSGPNGTRLASSFNNISFQVPRIAILQAYYWNISGVFREDFPEEPPLYFNFTGDVGNTTTLVPSTGTRVLTLDYNDVVEIVWQGTSLLTAENHPLHLHGFSFYVVGIGLGNFNNVTHPLSYNLIDPPLVNTFGLPKNGWVAMRFVADNPGVWYMHCHLDRHTSWGMDTVIIVRDGGTPQTTILPPPKYLPPCS